MQLAYQSNMLGGSGLEHLLVPVELQEPQDHQPVPIKNFEFKCKTQGNYKGNTRTVTVGKLYSQK